MKWDTYRDLTDTSREYIGSLPFTVEPYGCFIWWSQQSQWASPTSSSGRRRFNSNDQSKATCDATNSRLPRLAGCVCCASRDPPLNIFTYDACVCPDLPSPPSPPPPAPFVQMQGKQCVTTVDGKTRCLQIPVGSSLSDANIQKMARRHYGSPLA